MKSGPVPLPIRILHVIDNMMGMGGMEKNLVKLIQRMDPERFEHVVCVIRNVGSLADEIPRDRARVVCLGQMQAGYSFLGRMLVRLIEEIKPNIVHSRNWGGIEAVLAARWVGSSAVVHSEHGLDTGTSQGDPLRRRLLRRFAFHLADRTFAVSYALRDFHARNTGFHIDKMSVIHNGVDTDRFCPQEAVRIRMREKLGIGPSDFCIGTIGRLEPVKDLFTLLRATIVLPESPRNWRVMIAGDGSESAALKQLVHDQGGGRLRVDFLGEVQEVPDLLNALDVYVLPSLYEGISNSLLEAMATGLPVIASAVGGNTEVVADGQSGLLFAAGDARALTDRLKLIYEGSELSVRLGRDGRRRVEDCFSLKSMVQRYEAFYLSLVEAQ
jgi:sugar transferase (PEP-CTERM/EpsH1 system associated)